MNTITPREFQRLLASGHSPELIDVRSPEEFAEVHAVGAINVPLGQLEPERLIEGRERSADRSLYFICHLGHRSSRACEMVEKAGFPYVVNVAGGTDAWLEAGLPAERGKAKENWRIR